MATSSRRNQDLLNELAHLENMLDNEPTLAAEISARHKPLSNNMNDSADEQYQHIPQLHDLISDDEVTSSESDSSESSDVDAGSYVALNNTAQFPNNDPLLRAINEQAQVNAETAQKPQPQDNPFLPEKALQTLANERIAAQDSASLAGHSLQQAKRGKENLFDHERIARLTSDERSQLIDQTIEEIMPVLELRLRKKLEQLF